MSTGKTLCAMLRPESRLVLDLQKLSCLSSFFSPSTVTVGLKRESSGRSAPCKWFSGNRLGRGPPSRAIGASVPAGSPCWRRRRSQEIFLPRRGPVRRPGHNTLAMAWPGQETWPQHAGYSDGSLPCAGGACRVAHASAEFGSNGASSGPHGHYTAAASNQAIS